MDNQPPNTSGFDASVPLDAYIGGLSAIGISWVGRYIAPGAVNAWKVITPAEAVEYAIAGLALMPIFESTAQRSLDGAAAGAADGQFALSYLPTIGMFPNTGVVLEPTVDFDPAASSYPTIVSYFQAFAAALGSGYGIGAYAGGAVLAALNGVIQVRWLTQSMGFAGSADAAAAGNYDIIQRLPLNITVNGGVLNVDPDSLHVANGDIGARVPWGGAVPENATLSATSIQMLLNKVGQNPPLGVDDVAGNLTNTALNAWLLRNSFTSLVWGGPVEALLAQAGVSIYSPPTA